MFYSNLLQSEDGVITEIIFGSKNQMLCGFYWKIHPLRTKICISNTVLEQVSQFRYLGCNVSFLIDDAEWFDISQSNVIHLDEYVEVYIMLSSKKAREATKLIFYKTLAVTLILFGSET